jgi:hypothetical protein
MNGWFVPTVIVPIVLGATIVVYAMLRAFNVVE